eukprot:scaffold185882_cov28-Tisochrysis_lutea.AAC.3
MPAPERGAAPLSRSALLPREGSSPPRYDSKPHAPCHRQSKPNPEGSMASADGGCPAIPHRESRRHEGMLAMGTARGYHHCVINRGISEGAPRMNCSSAKVAPACRCSGHFDGLCGCGDCRPALPLFEGCEDG